MQTRTSYAANIERIFAQARSDVAASTISSQVGQMSRSRTLEQAVEKGCMGYPITTNQR